MTRIALLFLIIVCSNSTFARTASYKFVPENGATVPAGLDEISLSFAREVRLTSFKLLMIDPLVSTKIAARIDLSDAVVVPLDDSLPRGFNTEFTIHFDAIEAGTYVFTWAVVAKDGDVFDGRSQFISAR